MKSTDIVRTEDEEQLAFCDYLTARHIKFYHPPAEMYSSSWKQKARNKRMGATKGFPDLIIPLPDCGRLVCIEMKRTKGGVVSGEQWDWIKTLNLCGVHAYVAYGAEMAIEIIKHVESLPKLDFRQHLYEIENEQTVLRARKTRKTQKNPEDIF